MTDGLNELLHGTIVIRLGILEIAILAMDISDARVVKTLRLRKV